MNTIINTNSRREANESVMTWVALARMFIKEHHLENKRVAKKVERIAKFPMMREDERNYSLKMIETISEVFTALVEIKEEEA